MKTADGLVLDSRVSARPDLPMGPFVALGDGRVLTVGTAEALISNDNGRTWEKKPIFTPDQNLAISSERALVRTRDGAIVLVFMNMKDYAFAWNQEKSAPEPQSRLHVWAVRSLDGGDTWVDHQMIYKGYSGAVRDMLQGTGGNIVVPVEELLYKEARHATRAYVSTDDGRTWKKGNLLDIGGRGHHAGLMEGTLVELRDGRLWMLLRTNLGRFWSAYSDDGGLDWRVFQPSDIEASSAPALITRLQSGRLVLLWNRPLPEGATTYPLTGGDNQWSEIPVSNHREELSIAFSEDDARTWTKPVVIARLPGKWVSYPYVFEHAPGELWITTMQGDLRASLREEDFAGK